MYNTPLTDYLSRHPIAHEHEAEASCAIEEREAEGEFVVNQIYSLFEFIRANGSITQHIRRPSLVSNSEQSQHRKRTREHTTNRNSIQTLPPRNNIQSSNRANFKNNVPQMSKMDQSSLNSSSKNGGTPQKQINFAPREIKSFNQTGQE